MKKYLKLAAALFMLAALCAPAFSQEEGADAEAPAAEAPAKPAAKDAPAKRVPAKKKARKKKPEPPVSEYKFAATETIPSYKFDKRANPIIKEKKKPAKKATRAKGNKAAAPAVKFKPAKPLGSGDTPQMQLEQQGQSQPGSETE